VTTPFPSAGPVRSTNGPRPKPEINKRTISGLNFNPSLNVSFAKVEGGPGFTAGPAEPDGQGGPATSRPAPGPSGTPGSGFMSNEDIRAFSEAVRKGARNRAVERTLDAEQLESVLRHIPTTEGSLAGSLLRARRVSRHLKKIAHAEQVIAKEAAALYAQFEREYEAELRKVSRARPARPRPQFSF
jgi:hypothetical protein